MGGDRCSFSCLLVGWQMARSDPNIFIAIEPSGPVEIENPSGLPRGFQKWIGDYAAPLGGPGTMAFSGAIGENALLVRARICEALRFSESSSMKRAARARRGRFPGTPVASRFVLSPQTIIWLLPDRCATFSPPAKAIEKISTLQ